MTHRFARLIRFGCRRAVLAPAVAVVVSTSVVAPPAGAQEITWYGKARTQAFLDYCKPGLANKKSLVFRRCDTVWNAFKEGYFAGLDTAGRTCFIERAQLGDLIAHIEEQGEEYVTSTGWVFTMRDFLKARLKTCEEKRGQDTRR